MEQIRATIDRRTAELPQGDLAVLGYWEWREALERGIAAHHAGMLPAFKETVEELFVRGLVRAVFATETLALGINMPARTVVLERLVKFNGESHAELTPGEYTQLTGRAGRRGIDVEGHAVVIWQPGVDPEQVAGLASTRTYPLRSSFRPGYNMAVNLVGRLGVEAARELLEQSFAQFQADRSVVGLARRIERNGETLAGYAALDALPPRRFHRVRRRCAGACPSGRRRWPARGSPTAATPPRPRCANSSPATSSPCRSDGGRASPSCSTPGIAGDADPRPLVLTEDRWAGRLSTADFPVPVAALGRMRLPKRVDHRVPRVRRDLASALREHRHRRARPAAGAARRGGSAAEDPELATLRRALRAHPCHGCADREAHARWAERHNRLERETEQLRQKVRATTHSLARAFDRIRALLAERGYLDGETVTADGARLARLWGESDLLAAECLRHGVWDGLAPADLAAVVSALVYESRRDVGPVPRVPAGRRLRGAHRHRRRVDGAGGRRAPAPGGAHPRARPRFRLADAPVGAGRVARRGADGRRAERRRALRGRLRPLVPAGRRPARPGGRRGRSGRRRRPGRGRRGDRHPAWRRGRGHRIAGIFCAGPARVCQDPPIETRGDHA